MGEMKRIVWPLLIVLVVAALAAGGVLLYRTRTAAAASSASSASYTQVVTVKQGDLSQTISVVGQMAAAQSADLTFEYVSGSTQVMSMTVAAGNTVTKGQVLATIDPAPYQQALDQAESDLQASQKTLADLQTPATTLEIAQADAAVAQAEQNLEQAKADLANLESPDVSSLQSAVQNAQDNLALFQLQAKLANRDALAKSERDLTYTIAWYQRRIADLQELVSEHKANLQETEEITTDQEALAQAQADLAQVQAERALASQSRTAQLARDQAALTEAKEALAKGEAGGDPLALTQATVAVQNAQVSLESAKEARQKLVEGADATSVAVAKADVDKKQLAVNDAEAALAGTKLVAPFDGTVLKTNVSTGDAVTANTVVLSVANLKSLEVVAAVDETTIRQVSAGQDATITFDAFPGQRFKGKVLSVPMEGSLQGGVMVYDVPLSLSGAEKLDLLVGMTANIEIQVGQVTNALLVPTMALQKANGSYEVMVPNTTNPKGSPESVPVEVGLSNGTYTQITKGLNAGDQVIVQLPSTSTTTTSSRISTSSTSSLSRVFRFLGTR
jgi:HlyD family secretion protein